MSTNAKIINAKIINVILRFNFTEEIISMIAAFAKLHQFDDRKTYKEHWITWLDDNRTILTIEIRRLINDGYTGDVEDKMYKAGRYYFRKKTAVANEVKVITTKMRRYINMDKLILEEMDKHIILSIRTQQANNEHYTPATGYAEFCELYSCLLNVEKNRLHTEYNIDIIAINEKIKKHYKNRYFMITG